MTDVTTTPKPLGQYTADDLPQLAEVAKRESDLACASARTAIEHALAAGRVLNRASDLVNHGEWTAWLKANVNGVSIRTAQKYMKLAREWNTIPETAKAPPTAHLTIDKALAALANPTRKSAQEAFRKPPSARPERNAEPADYPLHEAIERLEDAIRAVLERWPSDCLETAGHKLISMGKEILETGGLRP